MTDIVKRLRANVGRITPHSLDLEAADEIESLRSRLADAEEELSQWQATGESVTRNEHDLAARLAEAERLLRAARAVVGVGAPHHARVNSEIDAYFAPGGTSAAL